MAKAKHTIRIISGTHRGRRFPVLDFGGLRPTGDRVRETVFNWLQFNMAGKKVVDLCAGAGSLGFEAASRQAQQVLMLETNQAVVQQLRKIQHDFKFNTVQIEHVKAEDYLLRCRQLFDVAFLDPPFADNLLETLTNAVLNHICVGGFIYREFAKNQEVINLPQNWELFRQKTMGQVRIELWQKISDNQQLKEENSHA